MREAIGNTFLFNVIIVFVVIFIIIFAGSSSYSKAAKVKNTIIDILVQNADEIGPDSTRLPNTVTNKINAELKNIGYRVNPNKTQTCRLRVDSEGTSTNGTSSSEAKRTAQLLTPTSDYRYCVWRIPSERGYYFKVTSYMYFEFPLVSVIEYPIEGESRVIYDEVEHEY